MGDTRRSLIADRVAGRDRFNGSEAEKVQSATLEELREELAEGASLVNPRNLTFGYAYHRLLLIADLAALLLGSAMTVGLLSLIGREVDLGPWFITVLAMAPVWVLIAYMLGLYGQMERRLTLDYVAEVTAVVSAATAWCWLVVLARAAFSDGGTELITPALMWIVMVPVILMSRSLARSVARSRPWFARSIALVGDAGSVELLDRRISRHPEWGLTVDLEVSRVEGESTWQVSRCSSTGQPMRVSSLKHVEGPGAMAIGLTALVEDAGIDRAMVAGGLEKLSSRTELVHTMIDRGIAVDYVSGGPETLYSTAIPQHLEGMSFLSSRPSEPRPLGIAIKRIIDIVLSAGLLLISAPILLWAAIRIKMDSPGPVIFRQERSGLDGEIFEIRKLRTMEEGAHDKRSDLRRETEADGNDDVLFKLENDPRVTKFGKKLRSTSLDELPQLSNVLIGDMSMVGPRPLIPEEAEQAHGMYRARSRVKPGIAGPWQAQGRSDIPFEDMIRLDYSYVAGWSLGEDLRLLLRTFSAVVGRSGAK